MSKEKIPSEMKNEAKSTPIEAVIRKSDPSRNTHSLQWSHFIPLPIRTIGGIRDQMLKIKNCTCKKSGCLKLYCDCFNSGIFCHETCKCLDCKNEEFKGQFEKDFRTEAIMAVLERNENAFRAKAQNIKSSETTSLMAQGLVSTHDSLENETTTTKSSLDRFQYKTKKSKDGCNCKKSACLKKYCECFQATLYCTGDCRCSNCENIVGNDKREILVAKLKKNDASRKDTGMIASEATTRTIDSDVLPENSSVGGIPANIVALLSKRLSEAGVDVFLPPGNFARPLLLPNGRVVTELGFRTVQDMSASDQSSSMKSSFDKDNRKREYSRISSNSQHDVNKMIRIHKDQMSKAIQNSKNTALELCQSSNTTENTLDLKCSSIHMLNDSNEDVYLEKKYSELAAKSVASIFDELNNIQKQLTLRSFIIDQHKKVVCKELNMSVPHTGKNSETIPTGENENTNLDKYEKEVQDTYEIVSKRTFIYIELARIIQQKIRRLQSQKVQFDQQKAPR